MGDKTFKKTETYVELQGGLHRFDPKLNDWVTCDPALELQNGGAVARNLQYKVTFAPNLASPGSLDIELADGRHLTGQIMGLAFTEGSKSALIAETKDCAGVITGPARNHLVYSGAFTDFDLDVEYVVELGGVAQNLIFKQNDIPDPTQYGLTANANLELFTEWTAAPMPAIESFTWQAAAGAQSALTDQKIDLGCMQFLTGKGFSLGGAPDSDAVAVAKSWETIQGRTFLTEKIPWQKLAPELQKLPAPQASIKPRRSAGGLWAKGGRAVPAPRASAKAVKPIEMALDSVSPNRGFCMDFDLVVSTNSFRFTAGTTFYISGPITVTTNVFEGTCVIKYAPTNSARLTINGPVTCLSSAYAPIVFTARDDSSIGALIGANPLSRYYAYYALDLNYNSIGTAILHDLRIKYAHTGINFSGGFGHVVSHAQILNCQTAFNSYWTDTTFRNVLLASVDTICLGTGYNNTTSHWEHVTLDQIGNFNSPPSCTFLVTNSLLVAVAATGPYSGVGNASNPTSASVFQTVGGAAHYLLNNNYRNIGTAGIAPDLAVALQGRTTYPPTVYPTNSINGNTTLVLTSQGLGNTGSRTWDFTIRSWTRFLAEPILVTRRSS